MTKFIKITLIQLFLVTILATQPALAAQQEDELAPGFNACMDRAASESYDAGADCYKKAGEYQSQRLDAAYKKGKEFMQPWR